MNSVRFPSERPVSKGWGWILGYGLFLILCGVAALLNPVTAGFVTGVAVGAILVVYGLLAIVAGISGLAAGSRLLEILLGLAGMLAGVFVLLDPLQGVASLAWTLGLWLLVTGIFQVFYIMRGGRNWEWRLALGAIDVVLGAYLLFSGPSSGFAFVAALVGFSFLFRGLSLSFWALRCEGPHSSEFVPDRACRRGHLVSGGGN